MGAQDAYAHVNLNVGLEALSPSRDAFKHVDMNVGFPLPPKQVSDKPIVGWGCTPAPAGTFIVVAGGVAYAHADINIV